MLQLAANLSLFDEPSRDFGPTGVLVQQHFYGQVAAQVDVAAAQHRAHPSARDLARQLVPVAHLLGRRHRIGLRFHNECTLAFGLTQQDRPQRPKCQSQLGQDTSRGIGPPSEPRRQACVERIRRNRGSIQGLVGILQFIHGRFSAFQQVLLKQDQTRARFRAGILKRF